MSLSLVRVKRTHPTLLKNMGIHYSNPKGFVGRNICYLVLYGDICYGSIVGGSATKHLPGRKEFLKGSTINLNQIINNIFYHVEGPYPTRNFTVKTLSLFRDTVSKDWYHKYGDMPKVFETLVELPRVGEVYFRDGWHYTGLTKGYTCKRTSGPSTDGWSGMRVWDKVNLRPKKVFMRHV